MVKLSLILKLTTLLTLFDFLLKLFLRKCRIDRKNCIKYSNFFRKSTENCNKIASKFSRNLPKLTFYFRDSGITSESSKKGSMDSINDTVSII